MKLKSPTKELVQSKNTTRGGGNTVDVVAVDDDPGRGPATWMVHDRWQAVKTVSTTFSRLGATAGCWVMAIFCLVFFAQHFFFV